MRRRTFVATTGIGLATLLAGCSDSSGDGASTPTDGGGGSGDSNGGGGSGGGDGQSLSVGESFTNGIGNTITVTDVSLQESVRAKRRIGDGFYQKEAQDGEQFVVVSVEVTNDSGQTQYLTPTMEIKVRANGTEYTHTAVNNDEDAYSPAEVQDGGSRSGWIVYSVPAGLALSDVEVVHSNSADGESWTAVWTAA